MFFFQNNGITDLEYCWADLVRRLPSGDLTCRSLMRHVFQGSTASAAGSACFPPVMPVKSEGLCTAADGTWAVG